MRAAVRVYGGWLVVLVGAILCAVGWYGVSGEKYEARQIPYLASATIPGAALIVAGAVLIAARMRGAGGAGGDEALRRQVAELHALVLEPADRPLPADAAVPGAGSGVSAGSAAGPADAAATADADPAGPWVSLPAGARYHRPDCELVRGKAGVFALDAARAAELDLRACALCDPAGGPAEAADAADGGAGISADGGAVGGDGSGAGDAGAARRAAAGSAD
ncbi:hypothetical protein [Yinghuangia soli]|uniref:Uncharacterized protein n=1 Tax=Yinghuangia soli TaxID=2908204 RepID=A0AA41Q864_9ACTN|nr:hypothetical protein [Yinghuangia soli]MCF2532991.1 hypothetical protein [Yinghuangia soli]